MQKKSPMDVFVYWGVFVFAAGAAAYLLLTMIDVSSQEESNISTAGTYQQQVRYVTVLTSEGSFKVAFMRAQAPVTVKNFVRLARSGFYDEQEFYNFSDGVFIENAEEDPTTPRLVAGNSRVGQIFEEGAQKIDITSGLVAMPARTGSQVDGRQILFFVEDEPSVVGEGYVVFGRVIEGMDVVERIAGRTPKTGSVSLESVTVE